MEGLGGLEVIRLANDHAVPLVVNGSEALIELIETPYLLSRPFAAPPGVPPARAKALQDAFMAVHKDKDYLADAAKLGIDVSPIDGNAIHSIIDKLAKMPPAELHSVQKLIEGG